jgi:predicted ATPase
VTTPAVLEEIRLPSFKSVRSAELPLRDLTLLVGRNGSGKSNVLEGLWVLSRLAGGGDIRGLLDGGRDGPAVRGGAEGCAPIGSDEFQLGCTVATSDGRLHLDVRVCVRPVVQVVHERLSFEPRSKKAKSRTLLESEAADLDSADIAARWDNRRPGLNPSVAFRASHLLTSQVGTRVPATTRAGRDVHDAADAVLGALRGVFVLDPIPHAMRQYVPARDHRLRRGADNLSAVLGRLFQDRTVYERLLEMARSLSESRIVAMTTEPSTLGDLMLVQREVVGGVEATVPARLMSDGTLRVLAILAALFETSDPGPAQVSLGDGAATTLVVEEIENGLHPSQAAAMVARVIEESRAQGIHTLATTHSPAMLDALPGADHEGVVMCLRDDEGWTRLQPLTELPNYFSVVAGGTLGRAAVQDRLRPSGAQRTPSQLIDELFHTG